jgi:ribonuclease R/exosome complex exonuclease DIS3/RRP44
MSKLKEGDIITGQIDFITSGSAYLKVEGVEDDIYVYKKNTLNALHMDTVEVEIMKNGTKLEGKVLEVIGRFKTEWVGTVQRTKDLVFVIPDSPKMSVDFFVPNDASMDAKDKQKVVVNLIKWKKGTKSPYAKITKILGDVGDNNTEMNSIMYEYGLPVEFPKDVELDAELISFEIPPSEYAKRRDMRNVLTFTIDPVDAKDFDDALSIETKEGYIEIGVHIADVTHYVKPDSKIEAEALKRATSVYLVDRCVPMLPERLSNGVCSLRPHEEKLCYSTIFKMDSDGNILDTWYGRTVIYSDHRFAYEQAQALIEAAGKSSDEVAKAFGEAGLNDMDFQKASDIANGVLKLDELAKKIRARRIKKGSLELDQAEVRFKLDPQGKPLDVYFKIQKDANKLIEEFMLLANQAVAKLLSDASYNNVYRIHDKPNQEKLDALMGVAQNFGYALDINNPDKIRESLNRLLVDIKGTPEENMISALVIRSMSKATYTVKNIGHYGLGFIHYSHFTSPIRRYPDMMTHRLLDDYLNKKPKGNPVEVENSAKWSSERELVAAKAQRDSIKYKQAEYLQDKIGRIYKGVISGVVDWGVYVEIVENKCEGMIRFKDLGKDVYSPDTDNYRVVGHNTGHVIRLGDEVMVVVKGVNLEKKTIDLAIM